MPLAVWMMMVASIGAGSLPPWLELHPGVTPATVESAGMVKVNYAFAGTPGEAVEHYRAVFERASVVFAPNSDGIGLTARASSPECDLMLQFHPSGSGTAVKIFCTAKRPAAQAGQATVMPPTAGGWPSREPGTQQRQSRRLGGMPIGRTSTSPGTPPHAPSDDTPPLLWPAWLTLIGTHQTPRPEKIVISGMQCLRASYRVDPSQRRPLIMAYRDLMQSYGFRVDRMTFSTGNTIGGAVIEDFRGFVEGFQSSDGSYGTAATILKVAFSRGTTVREPGTMYVSLCVRGTSK